MYLSFIPGYKDSKIKEVFQVEGNVLVDNDLLNSCKIGLAREGMQRLKEEGGI